jgi:hypothetical protein
MMATGFLLSLSVIPTVSLGNSAIQSAGAQTEPTHHHHHHHRHTELFMQKESSGISTWHLLRLNQYRHLRQLQGVLVVGTGALMW